MKKNILLGLILALNILCVKAQTPVSQWQQTSSPPGGSIWAMAAIGSNLFAGATNGGVYFSSDNGATWQQRNGNYSADQMRIYCMATYGSDLYVATGGSMQGSGAKVLKSSNLGMSWTDVSPSTTISDIRAMIITGNDIFIGATATGHGVYKSTLTNISSSTWSTFNTGLSNTTGTPDKNIRSIAVMGNDILVGTYGYGVFISPIASAGFNSISNGFGTNSDYIQALNVSGSTFLAGNISGTPVLYRSGNSGSSWSQADNSLFNDMPVYVLLTAGAYRFAGTEKAGVLVSADDGVTWGDFNQGFKDQNGNWFCNDINVRSFLMVGNQLYAGTDCGVWKTQVPQTVGLKKMPGDLSGARLFPNPFSASATLQLLERPDNGTLSLFDVVGRKVKTLSAINNNVVTIERTDLKAGIYFYEIETGTGIAYKGKFIVED
jgi:hypothetical protein